jgi:hypothetical protein
VWLMQLLPSARTFSNGNPGLVAVDRATRHGSDFGRASKYGVSMVGPSGYRV